MGSHAGDSAAGNSLTPIFSADGHHVLFVSHANNLVTNDSLDRFLDVFVHNLLTTNISLVSVSLSGTGGANENANYATISSNGQVVAFQSVANNLVASDTNGHNDIFVRDVSSGRTSMASINAAATGSGNGGSSNAVITSSGRFVAFESAASDLVENDTNGFVDIFVRDLQNGTTIVASTGFPENGHGFGSSQDPRISADGRLVAFVTQTTNGQTSGAEIYLRDLDAGGITWVSLGVTNLFPETNRCFNPNISADGSVIIFKSVVGSNAAVFLFRYQVQTRSLTLIASNVNDQSFAQISADGSVVAYDTLMNVFVWDARTSSTTTVGITLSGIEPGGGRFYSPALSVDGSAVELRQKYCYPEGG